jgi:hypothetical protein
MAGTRITFFTGAGVSAESGIRTFRDSDGLWEEYRIEEVATPQAFARDPALVLHFYDLRRAQVLKAAPNPAHKAIADLEDSFEVQVITQNIDDLHERAGSRGVVHMHGELLKARLGGEMTHVPYKDGALALSDVMGGQVQFMFYHPAAALPHIKSGKLRALGVSSAKRSPAAPEVPAIAEAGLDFDLVAWFMVYAPAATPAPVLARLRDAAAQTLANADIAGRLKAQGLELNAMRAEEMTAFGRSELAKWAELVRRSGAQVD